MKIVGIIPARYASSRFPGKPLAEIAGKSMIQRVYEQVSKSDAITSVVVATDDARIHDHVISFGGQVCMTRTDHASGTDRCYEAFTLTHADADYVINIQGDEPFIQPDQIDLLASKLDGQTEIATLIKKIEHEDELLSASEVKVVTDAQSRALYFSRAVIPRLHKIAKEAWFTSHVFYKHIGMYAFRADILKALSALPMSMLEKAESLEQLRWLENGYAINVAETETENLCIDTPEDLTRAQAYLKNLS